MYQQIVWDAPSKGCSGCGFPSLQQPAEAAHFSFNSTARWQTEVAAVGLLQECLCGNCARSLTKRGQLPVPCGGCVQGVWYATLYAVRHSCSLCHSGCCFNSSAVSCRCSWCAVDRCWRYVLSSSGSRSACRPPHTTVSPLPPTMEHPCWVCGNFPASLSSLP
jgi:hypothetical protein